MENQTNILAQRVDLTINQTSFTKATSHLTGVTVLKYVKDVQEPGLGIWYFEIDNDCVAY